MMTSRPSSGCEVRVNSSGRLRAPPNFFFFHCSFRCLGHRSFCSPDGCARFGRTLSRPAYAPFQEAVRLQGIEGCPAGIPASLTARSAGRTGCPRMPDALLFRTATGPADARMIGGVPQYPRKDSVPPAGPYPRGRTGVPSGASMYRPSVPEPSVGRSFRRPILTVEKGPLPGGSGKAFGKEFHSFLEPSVEVSVSLDSSVSLVSPTVSTVPSSFTMSSSIASNFAPHLGHTLESAGTSAPQLEHWK